MGVNDKVAATFHPAVENPYVWPWGQLSSYQLVDETVTVDGVDYDVDKIRTLVRERHALAAQVTHHRFDASIWRGYAERRQIRIEQLEARLDRADAHLRRRTAALVRLIAKKGARLEEFPPIRPTPDWKPTGW